MPLPPLRIISQAIMLVLLTAWFVPALTGSAFAQKSRIISEGREEFNSHCSACHGEDGRGRGMITESLISPAANLTAIWARNGGIFPFWRVYDIISGKKFVAGHKAPQMPAFLDRLKRDDAKPGYAPSYLRILMLTHYLESLQAK